jgi:hypothetical protein
MNIEEVMALARAYASEESGYGCVLINTGAYNNLRAALLALVAQERDEEAEACVDECGKCFTAETAGERIRARIAARAEGGGGSDD